MKVWILTFEANDYNQHGMYFEAVFQEKPTAEKLLKHAQISAKNAEILLVKGKFQVAGYGGWYNLDEMEAL